jgi:hypothetical protein
MQNKGKLMLRKMPFALFLIIGVVIVGLSLSRMYQPYVERDTPAYILRVAELLEQNRVLMDQKYGVTLIGSGGSFMGGVNGVSGRYSSLSAPGSVETARRMIVTGLTDFQRRINEDESLQEDLKPGGLLPEDIRYSVSFPRDSQVCHAVNLNDTIVYWGAEGQGKSLEEVHEEPFSTAVQIIEQENERMNHG